MKRLVALLALLLPVFAHSANGPIIWQGSNSKDLTTGGLITPNVLLPEGGSGSDRITVKAPASIAAAYDLTLPTTNGDADQCMVTNGSGVLSFTKIANANVDASAAIDATKLADGSVDDTEFERLGTAGTAGAGNLVTTDGTQTLTAKTLDADDNTISDIDNGEIKAAAGIVYSKLNLASSIVAADFASGAVVSESASGVMPSSHASFDDASATRLGLKQYVSGTNYKDSISPTVSGTNWTTARGVWIPYQMQDGTWRLRFNLKGNISVATTGITLTVNGVVFKNAQRQAITVVSATAADAHLATYTVSNTATIVVNFSTATDDPALSGDVELESKPTWAY